MSYFHRALVALMLGAVALTGCASPGPLAGPEPPSPERAAFTGLPRPDAFFRAPLSAPAGKATGERALQALPSYPHLVGPEFLASNPGPAMNADVAFNPTTNTYMSVFELNGDVYGRIFSSQGAVIIPDFPIATPNLESKPRVVYVSHLNQFMVVYVSEPLASPYRVMQLSSDALNVLAQRVSAAGALIGGPINVSIAAGGQDRPDLAYDPVNLRLLFVWQDHRSGDDDVMGRMFRFNDNSTVAYTAEMLIGNSAPDLTGDVAWQCAPRVAFAPQTGKYVVVFEDGRNQRTSSQDVYAQVVSATGQLLGENFAVSRLNARQGAPAIAYNPVTGFFACVFEDDSNGEADRDILGRALTADGTPIYGEGTVDNQYGVQGSPAIAFNPASWTWLVAWVHQGTPAYTLSALAPLTASGEVRGRHLGPWFEVGTPFAITPQTFGQAPSLAPNTLAEEFLAAYDRNDLSTDCIHAQRVDRGY